MAQHAQRAQPLLGTMVQVQIAGIAEPAFLAQAFAQVFGVIRHIGQVMSAHDPASDLGRLARARAGDCLTLDAHTVAVLRLARHWHSLSAGAFNPVLAAQQLGGAGQRPAFSGLEAPAGRGWQGLRFLDGNQVGIDGPLWLDLGGIAKGYAVDQAIAALRACGVMRALVNAGGDLRCLGAWPVQTRHADRLGRRGHLVDAALATSARAGLDTAFVAHSRLRSHAHSGRWNACTVQAPDCASADALTKWGLQAGPRAQRLARVLRHGGAQMWRSA